MQIPKEWSVSEETIVGDIVHSGGGFSAGIIYAQNQAIPRIVNHGA